MNNRKTETLVGAFILVGLAIIALLIIRFGNFDKQLANSYTISAQFNDASGVISGCIIKLGGASIGQVTSNPRLNDTSDAVIVDIKIYEKVRIPTNADLSIEVAGLLGDTYLLVKVPKQKASKAYLQAGDLIVGQETESIKELQQKISILATDSTKLIAKIDALSKSLNDASNKVNNDILSVGNITNINTAISNFGDTIDNFKQLSQQSNSIVAGVTSAIDKINDTIDSFQAEQLTKKVNKIADSAEQSLQEVKQLAAKASSSIDELNSGDGLWSLLGQNSEFQKNLDLFMLNLRQRGILWYKDKSRKNKK